MIQNRDAVFKICIFGDGGVGKTTLVNKYLTGLFREDMRMTIGTNFYRKNLDVESKKVSLQIWDFGGERSFRRLFPRYIEGSAGAIFMYDITRYSSLNNLDEWMNLVEKSLGKDNPISLIIVGGKSDLEEKRAVDKEVSEKIMHDYGFFSHIECSAKTGVNVEKIFTDLTVNLLKSINLF